MLSSTAGRIADACLRPSSTATPMLLRFEQIKQQIKKLASNSAAFTTMPAGQMNLPGQAEISGKLTLAVAQFQEVVRAAESQAQDITMDETVADETAALNHERFLQSQMPAP